MTAPLDPMDVVMDAVIELRTQVEDLRRELDTVRAAGGDPAAPAAAPAEPLNPRWFRDRAEPQDWDDLRDWVEDVRRFGSLGSSAQIVECWEQHPGVVEDLAALYQAWRQVMLLQNAGMRSGRDRDLPGPGSLDSTAWFTQAFWPAVTRRDMYRCMSCSGSTHQPER